MVEINNKTNISVPVLVVLAALMGYFFKVTTSNQKAITENQKAIAVIAAQFQMHCDQEQKNGRK